MVETNGEFELKQKLPVKELSILIGSYVRLKDCFEFLWHIFVNKVVCDRISIDLFTNSACLSVLCYWWINILLMTFSIGDTNIFNIILLGFILHVDLLWYFWASIKAQQF